MLSKKAGEVFEVEPATTGDGDFFDNLGHINLLGEDEGFGHGVKLGNGGGKNQMKF